MTQRSNKYCSEIQNDDDAAPESVELDRAAKTQSDMKTKPGTDFSSAHGVELEKTVYKQKRLFI